MTKPTVGSPSGSGKASSDGQPDPSACVVLSGMLADQRLWHPPLAAYDVVREPAKPPMLPVMCELFVHDHVPDVARAVLEWSAWSVCACWDVDGRLCRV